MSLKRTAALTAALIFAAVSVLPVSAEQLSFTMYGDVPAEVTDADAQDEEPSPVDEVSDKNADGDDTTSAEPGDSSGNSSLTDEDPGTQQPGENATYANVVSTDFTSVVINFSAVEGAVSYKVTDTKRSIVLAELGADTAGTDQQINGLLPCRGTYLLIQAVKADGSTSDIAYIYVRTRQLEAPDNVKILDRSSDTSAYTNAQLSWNSVEGAEGYCIYQKINGIEYFAKQTKKTDDTLYSIKAGSDYEFVVKAYIEIEDTLYYGDSSEASVIYCRPQTPKVSVKESESSVYISYNSTNGAEGYMIYRSEGKEDKYERISIRKGADNTSYTDSNVKPGETYSYKVRAYRTLDGDSKSYSEYSSAVSCTVNEYRTTTAATRIYPNPGFSENYLGVVASGQKVIYLGTEGRWVKISDGNVTGYIYNKAMGVASNRPANLNVSNMDAYVDDLLYDHGATPYSICNYVYSNVRYVGKPKGNKSRNQRAYETLIYRSGSCYYYSALCDYMLERAGYDHIIVEGYVNSNGVNGVHNWNLYKSSKGWRHLDSVPFVAYSGFFYDLTDAQLRSRRSGYSWSTAQYPAAI